VTAPAYGPGPAAVALSVADAVGVGGGFSMLDSHFKKHEICIFLIEFMSLLKETATGISDNVYSC